MCSEMGINFSHAILFGSYAEGKNHAFSDIDLALVSDDFTDDFIKDNGKISKANIRFNRIEPHTYSTRYFKKSDPFIDEIKRTGIVLK